ncbi:MAG: manganese efflux pump MntP family protein [Candidatus Bathyarchaeota archaeon]|jgi:putative Mn2+ efflux pump MntP
MRNKMNLGIDLYSLLLLSIGLAMDAFSVATVTGFGLGKVRFKDALRVSLTFGLAHIIMPIAGWLLGSTIVHLIQGFDHWLAFLLLAFVGVRMIMEAFEDREGADTTVISNLVYLLLFTVAVSIDALAVGLSFSLENISIWVPSLIIGAGTLGFTLIGLMMGNRIGKAVGQKSQIIGGLILIIIGVRIVLTHTS